MRLPRLRFGLRWRESIARSGAVQLVWHNVPSAGKQALSAAPAAPSRSGDMTPYSITTSFCRIEPSARQTTISIVS
jgi:hypothetical protein